jgi:hypothetical protein
MALEVYNDPRSKGLATDNASGPEHAPNRPIDFPNGVKIMVEQHDHVCAIKLRITSSGYIWVNEHAEVLLVHSTGKSPKGFIPWKQACHGSRQIVDFTLDEMPTSNVKCFKHCHREHKSAIPSYEFANSEEYSTFQSVIRGKIFVREHAAASINSHGSIKTQGGKRQYIKLWKASPDTSKITITIPLTTTTERNFMIEHVEISPQWMKWEKDKWDKLTGSRPGVRATFKRSSQSSPTISPQASAPRRLSFRGRRHSSISSESSSATLDVHNVADLRTAQKWKYIDIEFENRQGKDTWIYSRIRLMSPSQRKLLACCDQTAGFERSAWLTPNDNAPSASRHAVRRIGCSRYSHALRTECCWPS